MRIHENKCFVYIFFLDIWTASFNYDRVRGDACVCERASEKGHKVTERENKSSKNNRCICIATEIILSSTTWTRTGCMDTMKYISLAIYTKYALYIYLSVYPIFCCCAIAYFVRCFLSSRGRTCMFVCNIIHIALAACMHTSLGNQTHASLIVVFTFNNNTNRRRFKWMFCLFFRILHEKKCSN